MIGELSFVAAFAAWGVLPGLVLLYALDVDWSRVERVAAALGLSVALVAVSAYAVELTGLPVAPLPVAVVVLGACWIALHARRRLDLGRARSSQPHPVAFPGPNPAWVPWLVLLVPLVVAFELRPVYTDPVLPPTLHDGLDHANWFRLIYETRSLSPGEVQAPPLSPDGGPTYYPWGMHGWLALLAHSTTLAPMATFTRGLVAISAALSLSVYVFVAQFMGRGWPAVSAAGLSLMFWWLPYQIWGWGGYALLTGAVCVLPVSRLSLEAVRAWNPLWIAAAAACGVGLLLIHPSQALGALLITTVVAATLAGSRLIPWWCTLPFAVALALAGIAIVVGEAQVTPIGEFVEKARRVSVATPEDLRFRWPLGVYLDHYGGTGFPMRGRIGIGVLYVIGSVFALVQGTTRPLLALHVVFSLLLPLALQHTWLTALWYHTPERLWYLQYASLPALAALGIGGLLLLSRRLVGMWVEVTTRQALVIWPVFLGLFLGGLNLRYFPWVSERLSLFAHQRLSFTDHRVLADFQWIRDHVPPRETLFNAPADWGLSLPFTGHRTVFFSGGPALAPSLDWQAMINLLNDPPPRSSEAALELRQARIRYLYAASFRPGLMPVNALPLNTKALKANPALELLYESATAAVFRIRDLRTRDR